MSTAVIICKGDFPKTAFPRYLVSTADVILCCDGAFDVFRRNAKSLFGHDRLPDRIVGDLDSLSISKRKELKDIIIHVEEQDDNDMTKAFRYLMENYTDVDNIHIIGATGKSEAHTVANISLLCEYERVFKLSERGISLDMISDYSTVFALSDSSVFDVGSGRKVSIFSMDPTLNIKSEGLVWQLDGIVFDSWWKASLNRASKDRVSLVFSHPAPVIIILD